MVGLPGFGPGSRAPEAHSLDQASRQPHAIQESKPSTSLFIPKLIPKPVTIDWESYRQWYLQNHNKSTLGYAINYAVQYADILADASKVRLLSSLNKDKRRLVMIALANLSKCARVTEKKKQHLRKFVNRQMKCYQLIVSSRLGILFHSPSFLLFSFHHLGWWSSFLARASVLVVNRHVTRYP
jgi:hypothetical protein